MDAPSAKPTSVAGVTSTVSPAPASAAVVQPLVSINPAELSKLQKLWFPSRNAVEKPKMRLVCFPCAGGSESIYTKADRNGRVAVLNPLMKWAQENSVEVLAVQPPGRDRRLKESFLQSCQVEHRKCGSQVTLTICYSAGTVCILQFSYLVSFVCLFVCLFVCFHSKGSSRVSASRIVSCHTRR
jgi:hypothetical protein